MAILNIIGIFDVGSFKINHTIHQYFGIPLFIAVVELQHLDALVLGLYILWTYYNSSIIAFAIRFAYKF